MFSDPLVRFLYHEIREYAPFIYRLAISRRTTALLGWLNYDFPLGGAISGNRSFLAESGIDLGECVAAPEKLKTARQIFERRIRYWNCRPMPEDPGAVVSPADARLLVGSLAESNLLFLKGKLFDLEALLGRD